MPSPSYKSHHNALSPLALSRSRIDLESDRGIMKKEMQEMGSIKIEDSATKWNNVAMSEVTRGHESAIKLAIVLGELLPPPTEDRGLSSAARALVDELLGSFSKAMVALGATKAAACRSPMGTNTRSTCDEWGDEIAGGKNKASPARRGTYRRRAHPYNWKTTTSKTITDGYSWRKYGQKEIYGSKYQRSYFRCTHKHDQGCKATRQVQISEEDPSVYLITYMGDHTCRSDMDALASINTPHVISFSLDAGNNGSQGSPVSAVTTTSLPSLNQEADEEVVNSRAPGCSFWEHDYGQLGWATRDVMDHGDVISLSHDSSASNSGMDVTEESFDVDEFLNLDHQDEFYCS